MATRKIAVLVGSLRKESFTRKLAKSLMLAAPPTLELEIVEIGDMPLYNQDDETDTPPATWTEFRGRIRDADPDMLAALSEEFGQGILAAVEGVAADELAGGGWGARARVQQCDEDLAVREGAVEDGNVSDDERHEAEPVCGLGNDEGSRRNCVGDDIA